MMTIRKEETASMMRRAFNGTRSTKNATPTFSPRSNALAAPKNAEPTIRPRAISSDHSTGALKIERRMTEPMTTARSAASNTAAIASVKPSSRRRGERTPSSGRNAARVTLVGSDRGRLNLIDDRLGLGMLLDEILRLHRDALAECGLVDVAHGHALFLED